MELRTEISNLVGKLYSCNTSIDKIQEIVQERYGIFLSHTTLPWVLPRDVPLKHERRYVIEDTVKELRDKGHTYKEIRKELILKYGFTVSKRVLNELIHDLPPQGKKYWDKTKEVKS